MASVEDLFRGLACNVIGSTVRVYDIQGLGSLREPYLGRDISLNGMEYLFHRLSLQCLGV